MIKGITSTILRFDAFGETVSPLNIKGHKKQKTTCGGLTGIFVFVIMVWFTATQFVSLVLKLDPELYQVQQGMDISEGGDKTFRMKENLFTFGIGAKYTYMQVFGSDRILTDQSVDISPLFEIRTLQDSLEVVNVSDSGKVETLFIQHTIGKRPCDQSNEAETFFLKHSFCVDDVLLKGSTKLRKGKDLQVQINKTPCLLKGEEFCDESQLELIELLKTKPITIVLFI